MLWHDTSTISDHSYLLMMVKCLLWSCNIYTNEEYEHMYNKKINIQVEIEKPVIYILARCPPTDDQIKYIDTRLEDLNELKTTLITEKGSIKHIMRFFHGDGPACSFEIGHQKSGNYFCWDCYVHADYCNDIPHTFYTSSKNINSRIGIVSATTTSQTKLCEGKLKLYDNLDKVDLIDELHQRNVSFFQSHTKEFLKKIISQRN
jgi:hypothetical protein